MMRVAQLEANFWSTIANHTDSRHFQTSENRADVKVYYNRKIFLNQAKIKKILEWILPFGTGILALQFKNCVQPAVNKFAATFG